jgi:hypothetical protein
VGGVPLITDSGGERFQLFGVARPAVDAGDKAVVSKGARDGTARSIACANDQCGWARHI